MACFFPTLFASLLLAGATGSPAPSSAEQKIAAAKRAIGGAEKSVQGYNDLAVALCDRAAETGKVSYFAEADTVLEHSFQLASGDYSAQKIHVTVLLGLHRWTEAWQEAKSLNHRVPDDLAVWGLLAEANLALGNYAEAQRAAQWMLDLRPGNVSAFVPAAKVREVYGDVDGAIDFVNEALRRTPEDERERRAFLLTESARLSLLSGDLKRASAQLSEAVQLFPGFYYALKVSALLEKRSAHFDEAASLLGRRYKAVETPAALYDYADMLQLAGRKAQAAVAFRDFESRALAEADKPYNSNRELIFYYAGRAAEPLKALRIAKQELAVRHDICTLDANAWALFQNGKLAEAKAEIALASATGTRDPAVLSHAKQIAGAKLRAAAP